MAQLPVDCGLDGWNSLGPLSMAERVETVGHSVATRILRLADEIRARNDGDAVFCVRLTI